MSTLQSSSEGQIRCSTQTRGPTSGMEGTRDRCELFLLSCFSLGRTTQAKVAEAKQDWEKELSGGQLT